MRNLQKVFPPRKFGIYHAVVTDRFYTSVQLALQLLPRNVYSVGTIQTNKKGFPSFLITKDASRPADVSRGSAAIAVAKCCPLLQAMHWWDRLFVYLLSTGSGTTTETCGRRIPGGQRLTVPCPSAMRDYHRWMGGVDIHDQLRLQRYSLQLSVGFRKYYKTIFMGLVDMAIVNAFIVYREGQKQRGEPTADHAEFLRELQAQLLQVTAADLIDESPQPDPTNPSGQGPTRHKLVEFPEWVQIREGVRKRPQHQCKVCSIRKKKVGELRATRFYCETCSDGSRRVYLCGRTGKSGHRLASGATFKCARLARSAVVAVREDGGSNEEAEQEEQEDVQQEEPQEDVEEVEPQVVVVQGDAEQEAVGQEGEEEEVAVVGTSAKEAEE
ncbi:hypothetical protein PR002_g24724 [Phytophthora rubi]|uniref:PiggyBac transposable element-derived protein domain-containing protein n=1 Tax=Phytophthora rubi TaxID=129364 RepID=A0A6A3IF60_9STRA|nr:hypothetical protein PR002_g24724 [Phytophthora rubi]